MLRLASHHSGIKVPSNVSLNILMHISNTLVRDEAKKGVDPILFKMPEWREEVLSSMYLQVAETLTDRL